MEQGSEAGKGRKPVELLMSRSVIGLSGWSSLSWAPLEDHMKSCLPETVRKLGYFFTNFHLLVGEGCSQGC